MENENNKNTNSPKANTIGKSCGSQDSSTQAAATGSQQLIPKDFQTIVAGFFPNTQYFDMKFRILDVQIDHLTKRQDEFEKRQDEFKNDVNRNFQQIDKRFEQVEKRFEQVEKRFEQVEKRFEQVDKKIDELKDDVNRRFEQVDKRFEQVIFSIDKLTDRLECRDNAQRNFTIRMFSISILVSILGVLGAFLKITGVF